jgi:hypothetical protein
MDPRELNGDVGKHETSLRLLPLVGHGISIVKCLGCTR